MSDTLTFFLAGIIQGSLPDAIHDQDYRAEIGRMVRRHFPDASVFDPFADHPDSLAYDPERGRAVFFDLMDRARESDVVIAFVPEASMGTAIEMWRAHRAGRVVVAVSPLAENWVVRFTTDRVVPDVAGLERLFASGELAALLAERRTWPEVD